MTQRRDSVFKNIINNEPVAETTQSELLLKRKLSRFERLHKIAIILMNLSEMAEAKDALLDNEGEI